jgi:hypothetical protein
VTYPVTGSAYTPESMLKDTPRDPQITDSEWFMFKGGELEGRRPKTLCRACRARLHRAGLDRSASLPRTLPLCFQCYRAELEREKALKAAGQLDTASEARFQFTLPFDPVNTSRLQALKTVRANERAVLRSGIGRFAEQRHRAQIRARHMLRMFEERLRPCRATAPQSRSEDAVASMKILAAAAHVAELQLPESWLPFVVSR